MKEDCINIFAYGDEIYVRFIGYRIYEVDGSYEDISNFLKSRVIDDHTQVSPTALDQPITWENFNSIFRMGRLRDLMPDHDVFPENPICCATPIVDGVVRIDDFVDFETDNTIPDYLVIYTTDSGIDIPRLINDDYLVAVKLLWNSRKYISALKLIFSMVDTLGFIEYGPTNGCFIKWLDEYCSLEELGVTSEELWELRNSILHMTNLDSRKTKKGAVRRLLPIFTANENEYPLEPDDALGYFHVLRFCTETLPKGIANWVQTYNVHREKFVDFVTRYDTIVSEARLQVAYLQD